MAKTTRNSTETGNAAPKYDAHSSPSSSESLTNRLLKARTQYAHEWSSGNARQFDMQGHYDWMAGFLQGHRHVLEIGTGSGSGTLALLSAGHIVVSIDENPECLKLAEQRLKSAGHAIVCENRETVETGQQGYRVRYRKPASTFPTGGALLLEGDILNDPALLEWIGQSRSFDAIACWLIGTYFERTQNEAISGLVIAGPGDYRLRVHRALSTIADRILPRGGVLHLVDRGPPPDSELAIQQHRNYHTHVCAGTTLKAVTMDYVRYNEPPDNAGPAIQLTLSSSAGQNAAANPTDTSFISAVFRKE